MNLTPQIIEALHLQTSASNPEQPSSNATEADAYIESEKRRDIPVPLPKRHEIYVDKEPEEEDDNFNDFANETKPEQPQSNIIEPTERQIVAKDTDGNNAYKDAYATDNSPLTTSGMESERLQRIAAQLNRENVRKKIIATREKMAKSAEKYNTVASNINDRVNQVANTNIPIPNIALGRSNKPLRGQNNSYAKRIKTSQPDYFGDFGGSSQEDVIFGGMGNYNKVTHVIHAKQPKQTKQQALKVNNANYDPLGFGGLGGATQPKNKKQNADQFAVGMSFDIFGVGSPAKPKTTKPKTSKAKTKHVKPPARKPAGQPPYRLGNGIF